MSTQDVTELGASRDGKVAALRADLEALLRELRSGDGAALSETLERRYVDTLLILLQREVTLEGWAATSGSPSVAAACRPEWREELCDRIERRLYGETA